MVSSHLKHDGLIMQEIIISHPARMPKKFIANRKIKATININYKPEVVKVKMVVDSAEIVSIYAFDWHLLMNMLVWLHKLNLLEEYEKKVQLVVCHALRKVNENSMMPEEHIVQYFPNMPLTKIFKVMSRFMIKVSKGFRPSVFTTIAINGKPTYGLLNETLVRKEFEEDENVSYYKGGLTLEY
jgi:hypothetical protein